MGGSEGCSIRFSIAEMSEIERSEGGGIVEDELEGIIQSRMCGIWRESVGEMAGKLNRGVRIDGGAG